jgi:FkbM family methyltransferase
MDDLVGLPNDLFGRKGTSDEGTWEDTFFSDRAWHRPPTWLHDRLMEPSSTIVDLGANVGYTTFDYFTEFDARIIAVEPDKENYNLMLLNMNGCANVDLQNVAVSNISGYGRMIGEAYNARKLSLEGGDVQVVLLDDIIWENIRDNKPVDFIKFDIEGAERDVIKHGGDWVKLTTCLKVEVHDGYSVEECVSDLEGYGFIVEKVRGHDYALLAHKTPYFHWEPPPIC